MAVTPEPRAPKPDEPGEAERKRLQDAQKKAQEGQDEPEKELQKFPAWRYHKDHPAVIVNSEEEAKKLGGGWSDAPVDFIDGDDHRRDDPSYQNDPCEKPRPDPRRNEPFYPSARKQDPEVQKDAPARPSARGDDPERRDAERRDAERRDAERRR